MTTAKELIEKVIEAIDPDFERKVETIARKHRGWLGRVSRASYVLAVFRSVENAQRFANDSELLSFSDPIFPDDSDEVMVYQPDRYSSRLR